MKLSTNTFETNNFSRYTNMLNQRCQMSNIFWLSAATIVVPKPPTHYEDDMPQKRPGCSNIVSTMHKNIDFNDTEIQARYRMSCKETKSLKKL